MRSKSVNVSEIAQSIGGGGHAAVLYCGGTFLLMLKRGFPLTTAVSGAFSHSAFRLRLTLRQMRQILP